MKLEEKQLIDKIGKLLNGEGTDIEQEEWVNSIRESVPFYEKIIYLLFWSDEELSPDEIFAKAKQEHSPIII
jgi:hypothetical protein